jgi:hypothetical protein
MEGVLELFAFLLFMSLFVCLALLTREMQENAKRRHLYPEDRQIRFIGRVWVGMFVMRLVIGIWFVIYLARHVP